jgi:hypothetical protein
MEDTGEFLCGVEYRPGVRFRGQCLTCFSIIIAVAITVLCACGLSTNEAASAGQDAPSGLNYSVNPAVYAVGTTISSDTPSSSGGKIATYSVSPTLPAGLRLDTSTGIISGTPIAVSPAVAYVVTAANAAGSATSGLSITVDTGVTAPTGLTYSVNPASRHEHQQHETRLRADDRGSRGQFRGDLFLYPAAGLVG